MILDITFYGNPVLMKKATKVINFNQCLKRLSEDMIDTLKYHQGIGIAAQQVNKTIQICAIDISCCSDINNDIYINFNNKKIISKLIMPLIIINPIIISTSKCQESSDEGCLSLPKIIFPNIKRFKDIKIKYQDLEGNYCLLECSGLLARCIQHEIDHLNGIMINNKIKINKFKKIKEKLNKLKNHFKEF